MIHFDSSLVGSGGCVTKGGGEMVPIGDIYMSNLLTTTSIYHQSNLNPCTHFKPKQTTLIRLMKITLPVHYKA